MEEKRLTHWKKKKETESEEKEEISKSESRQEKKISRKEALQDRKEETTWTTKRKLKRIWRTALVLEQYTDPFFLPFSPFSFHLLKWHRKNHRFSSGSHHFAYEGRTLTSHKCVALHKETMAFNNRETACQFFWRKI